MNSVSCSILLKATIKGAATRTSTVLIVVGMGVCVLVALAVTKVTKLSKKIRPMRAVI